MSFPKVFSYLTPKASDLMNNQTSKVLLSNDWICRTNPPVVELSLTQQHKNQILYVPNSEYMHKYMEPDLIVAIPETSLVIAPNCSQEVLKWAVELLKKNKLPVTPFQLSVVFCLYGYNSPVSSSIVITSSTHPLLLDSKVPVLDMNKKQDVQVFKSMIK